MTVILYAIAMTSSNKKIVALNRENRKTEANKEVDRSNFLK